MPEIKSRYILSLTIVFFIMGLPFFHGQSSAEAASLEAMAADCKRNVALLNEASDMFEMFGKGFPKEGEKDMFRKTCRYIQTTVISTLESMKNKMDARVASNICPSGTLRQVAALTNGELERFRKKLKDCTTSAVQKNPIERPRCKTPPNPIPKRTEATTMCFRAENNNSPSHCVYSFTYKLSDSSRSHRGQNVNPGDKPEICSLKAGVDISFEKWTPVGTTGR